MTRIGFAYNQKPDEGAPHAGADADAPRADEEPPSTRRDALSRSPAPPHSPGTLGADGAAPSATLAVARSAHPTDLPDDEFAEWDSVETIDAVEQALAAFGTVIRLEANESFPERLRAARPDIVFNMAEGLSGVNREAHVPAICEFFGVPYSGSDPFTLSLCLDKARTKETLAFHGVPTAAFRLVRTAGELDELLREVRGERRGPRTVRALHSPPAAGRPPLRLPLFAKPVHEGSSKGITERSLCRTVAEAEEVILFLLEQYRQPVLVEEYLPGAEFTCAVLGNGAGAQVLPIIGMNFDALPPGALPVYSFEAKWVWDRPDNPLDLFECPARVSPALEHAIENVTLDAYRVLGCRDWSRVDVRLDARGVPNVVEVNPLPGILPDPADNSCFPKAARAAGIEYDELIQTCLALAAERQGVALRGRAARACVA
jgi:D-alanine-D-alanine ligase